MGDPYVPPVAGGTPGQYSGYDRDCTQAAFYGLRRPMRPRRRRGRCELLTFRSREFECGMVCLVAAIAAGVVGWLPLAAAGLFLGLLCLRAARVGGDY